MEAILNITVNGEMGNLPDPVNFDATDADIRAWATEAVAAGNVPGIAAATVDFSTFVIDRFAEKDGLPNRLMIRPKTPFGV
jgi:hypothetical protein